MRLKERPPSIEIRPRGEGIPLQTDPTFFSLFLQTEAFVEIGSLVQIMSGKVGVDAVQSELEFAAEI